MPRPAAGTWRGPPFLSFLGWPRAREKEEARACGGLGGGARVR